MMENERVGYEKLKEMILKAGDNASMKRLEQVGEYPGVEYGKVFWRKCMKVRRLQGKYGLAVRISFKLLGDAFRSPCFRWSDVGSLMKAEKANSAVIEYLFHFDMKPDTREYQVPVYYILGGDDWQTPFVLAQEYFHEILAPDKELYMIPDAGHMTMMDQPQLFWEALDKVQRRRRA